MGLPLTGHNLPKRCYEVEDDDLNDDPDRRFISMGKGECHKHVRTSVMGGKLVFSGSRKLGSAHTV